MRACPLYRDSLCSQRFKDSFIYVELQLEKNESCHKNKIKSSHLDSTQPKNYFRQSFVEQNLTTVDKSIHKSINCPFYLDSRVSRDGPEIICFFS